MLQHKNIAFYLPQYHSIPENDSFWGGGFTEWTNVKKANPLFRNHQQPIFPSEELGYYNLLEIEIRKKQGDIARKMGLNAFCYWHYYFGNEKTVLDKPLKKMLKDGQPDFPFMLGWANESWTGIWHGLKNEIIIKQDYFEKDIKIHFDYLRPFFEHENHLESNGKLPFLILKPDQIPYLEKLIDCWCELALKHLNKEILFISYTPTLSEKIDLVINSNYFWTVNEYRIFRHFNQRFNVPLRKDYKKMLKRYKSLILKENELPVIFSGWDNTPRLGKKGFLFENYSLSAFYKFYFESNKKIINHEHKIIFIKSWNEWAEGNILESQKGQTEIINFNNIAG